MNAEIVFWGIVVAGAVLIGWITWPTKSANVVPFKKPKGKNKKSERNHLDAIYNPKQYRRQREKD
ncbi:hypothetical protein [Comamonas jiangduensis]|uniref:hypothetical protein n=1 Tax=Comamonas jiangduensis TaxID=1194168 RepID=UPI0028AAD7F6|nr:hypothetical protein [Comamonas jiangduensis]